MILSVPSKEINYSGVQLIDELQAFLLCKNPPKVMCWKSWDWVNYSLYLTINHKSDESWWAHFYSYRTCWYKHFPLLIPSNNILYKKVHKTWLKGAFCIRAGSNTVKASKSYNLLTSFYFFYLCFLHITCRNIFMYWCKTKKGMKQRLIYILYGYYKAMYTVQNYIYYQHFLYDYNLYILQIQCISLCSL